MNRSLTAAHRRLHILVWTAAALATMPVASNAQNVQNTPLKPGFLLAATDFDDGIPPSHQDAPQQPGTVAAQQPGTVAAQQPGTVAAQQPGSVAAQQPAASQPNLPDTISAPPFTVADKFDYRVVQSFGARGFVGAAIGAAIGQARNSPHEWGQGFGGFAERYGSGFAGNLSHQTFAFVLDSAFKEDPRYFPSEDKRMKMRAINALKQVIFCRTDDGGDSFAWSRVMSQFASGQFTNVWQPKSTGSVSDGVIRALIGFGADAGYDFLQEFVPFTRPRSLRHRH